jgi:hypothetical protein
MFTEGCDQQCRYSEPRLPDVCVLTVREMPLNFLMLGDCGKTHFSHNKKSNGYSVLGERREEQTEVWRKVNLYEDL